MSTEAQRAEITIERNDEARRYELRLDGDLAGYAQFRTNPQRITFTHTVVLPEYGGKGLGSRLAKHVLDDAVERGDTIVPVCPFIGHFLKEHPEYEASVDWP
ncbi:GNAT family N-acetyltransferase [Agromyces sp. Marseille-P2726]|uniref:GNAT family N-acetyltransferase n=1 Tax=Agromyces sp. Marseille-P2726 TaxID=2709132 RepID=UPI00156F7E15|nr:GNAT family N-acetyltransferase [Agromyces sp. Marseille-P2726]